MADICIRCGKYADGLLCFECAAPPAKKVQVEPPKAAKIPEPVVIAVPVIASAVMPRPVLPPRVVEPPKPPKEPKPPKVKRLYSAGEKRKVGQLVVVVLIATVVFGLLPQIKSGLSSSKDFISSKFTQETTPIPATTQEETSFPTPTPTPTPTQTPSASPTPTKTKVPSASPTPTKTKAVKSGSLTESARSAVVASLEKCALSTVYSPPGCPFEETAFIHGTSVYWTLSGVPKITLVSSKAEVLTLLVLGKAVVHVYYGKKLRDVDHPFSRTAIATPSGATYIIKWK